MLVSLLRAGGATLAAAALALAIMPPSRDVAPSAPVAPAVGDLPAMASVDAESLAVEIIVASVFAPDRTPPSSRYMPEVAASDSSGSTPLSTGMAPVGFEPLLFGTMVRPAGSFALVQFRMTEPSPRLVRVGDRDGDWSVVSISPRAVVVAGPAGRVTLRLPTEEARP